MSRNVSISILTYNRPKMLAINLEMLAKLQDRVLEVIVIDNSSNSETEELVLRNFSWVKYEKNYVNTGVAGRNRGISLAQGEIVITLDDDVTGLNENGVDKIEDLFLLEKNLGALCFRVMHAEKQEVCNWCHHRKVEEASLLNFKTYEISEGAVAFRKIAFEKAGGYYEPYFISHEGKDLAFRIMNFGYFVCYDGQISVDHHIAKEGRPDWRRYYFDTRNAIWLAIRNMPLGYGFRFLSINLLAMATYCFRDGFAMYWFKGVNDGVAAFGRVAPSRKVWNTDTKNAVLQIDSNRPSIWYKIKRRLFRIGVQI